MVCPKDNRYTTTHEWVRMEDGLAVIGITDYAAGQLSDITYVELPAVGEDVSAETVFGTIESVKAAADLMSPIDGEVIETNETVVEDPEVLGSDPYDDGWLVKLKPTDPSQLEILMTAEEYETLIAAGEEEEGEEVEVEDEEEEEEEEGDEEEDDEEDLDDGFDDIE